MEPLECSIFMWSCDVAGGMEHHHTTAESICEHAKRRLLAHGPTRKEDGSGHAQERHDHRFELGDDSSVSIEVWPRIGRDLREQISRVLVSVIRDETGTGRQKGHHVWLSRRRVRLFNGRFGLSFGQLDLHLPFGALGCVTLA